MEAIMASASALVRTTGAECASSSAIDRLEKSASTLFIVALAVGRPMTGPSAAPKPTSKSK